MDEKVIIDILTKEAYDLTGGILGLYLFIDDHFIGPEGITLEDISALNGLTHAMLEISQKHDLHVEEFSQKYRDVIVAIEHKEKNRS